MALAVSVHEAVVDGTLRTAVLCCVADAVVTWTRYFCDID